MSTETTTTRPERAYTVADTSRPKLLERGNVYVTLAALERFLGVFRRDFDGAEQARIELTRYCCEATLREDGPPAYYRYRSRPEGVDLTLRVVDETPLAIVVSLEARRY